MEYNDNYSTEYTLRELKALLKNLGRCPQCNKLLHVSGEVLRVTNHGKTVLRTYGDCKEHGGQFSSCVI